MKKLFLFFTSVLFFALTTHAQTKKDGTPNMRYGSGKQSSRTSSAPSQSTKNHNGSRPVYSGQTHTTSHEGTYKGQQNSQSHKGGKYTNPKSNNNYGIHKTK